MEGFHEALQTLSENPGRCSVAPESDAVELEIRQFSYRTKSRRSYRALFTIQGDEGSHTACAIPWPTFNAI